MSTSNYLQEVPYSVGFAGRIGSGKSTIARATASFLGVSSTGFGDYIRHVAESLGLEPNDRLVLQDIGNLLVKHPTAFCRSVLAHTEYKPGGHLVVEGIRHKQILDELRAQVEPSRLVLVFVNASDPVITERLAKEGRGAANIRQLEQDPTESQVSGVLRKYADLEIMNDEDLSEGQLRASLIPSLVDRIAAIVASNTPPPTPQTPTYGGLADILRSRSDLSGFE